MNVMRRVAERVVRCLLTWTLRSIAGAAVLSLAAEQAFAACDPQFVQVNQDGFGDRDNAYSWAMSTFIDKRDLRTYLYVGTANFVQGAEIWRYDGTVWQAIVVGGFGNVNNQGARALQKFQKHLYAGTVNKVEGAEIWRTLDGLRWERVVSGGFSEPRNVSIRGVHTFQQHLYVGTQTNEGARELGAGQIWRSADGMNWEAVSLDGLGDPNNLMFSVFEVFNGELYAGTKNTQGGAQLWRSKDGVGFTQVIGPQSATPSGFGIEGNDMIMHLKEFNGHLYVGTGNYGGFSLQRTADGEQFQEIGRGGMGDPRNILAWRFHVYETALWLGILNYAIGGRAWRSFDGLTWQEMVGPHGLEPAGFGEQIDWGIRSFVTYNGKLYLGTAQCVLDKCVGKTVGTEVWEWPGEKCP